MRGFPSLTIAAMLALVALPPNASALWAPAGNPLCNIAGFQYPSTTTRAFFATGPATPSIAGMYVVWQDGRSGEGDLYVEGVTEAAPPDPAPGRDGMPFVVAPGNQWQPAVTAVQPIPNGAQAQSSALIATWIHDVGLRAKRFGDGADWGSVGVPVAPADALSAFQPAITDDGGRGAIIVWLQVTSSRHLVRAQRLDELGNRVWGDAGVPVGADTTVQGEPRIVRAPDGGAYILRTDYRIAGTLAYQRALALYRLDGSGAPAAGWPAAGVLIGSEQPGFYLMVADGSGGVYVAWMEQEPLSNQSLGIETRVTRIQSDGTPAPGWTLAGVAAIARDDGNRILDDLDLDGTGGVVLVAEYERVAGGPLPSGRDLVVQRLLANGTRPAPWPAEGRTLCDQPGLQYEARLIGQGGGLLAAWRDDRSGTSDLYTLRLEPDGTPAAGWDPTGLLLCGEPGSQLGVKLAPNASGGAVFVWQDSRDNSTAPDLYIQTVNARGQLDVSRPAAGPLALTAPRPMPAHGPVDLVLEANAPGTARIEIVDAAGRVLQRWSLAVGPGSNPIRWDLRAGGRRVPPGVYHVRVGTPWGERTRRVVVL